jgi:hypothetical protein
VSPQGFASKAARAVDSYLWHSVAPHRIALMPASIDIPTHVGPCEFGQLGNQIAVRCPQSWRTSFGEQGHCGSRGRGAGWYSGDASGQ